MPLSDRPQAIGDGGIVVRISDTLGEQAISARHLVEGTDHERVIDEVDGLRGRALQSGDHQIEVIVGAAARDPYGSPLGGVGIDVVEMLEARWVFEIAEQGHSVAPGPLRGDPGGGSEGEQRDRDGGRAGAQREGNAQSTLLQVSRTGQPNSPRQRGGPHAQNTLLWFWKAVPLATTCPMAAGVQVPVNSDRSACFVTDPNAGKNSHVRQ